MFDSGMLSPKNNKFFPYVFFEYFILAKNHLKRMKTEIQLILRIKMEQKHIIKTLYNQKIMNNRKIVFAYVLENCMKQTERLQSLDIMGAPL